MPYFVCEDVGTTPRKAMTPTRVTRLWEKHKGRCIVCRRKIDGTREKWFIEHLIALELGGADDDENAGPAHLSHKADKDAADHRAAARAKRRKRVQLGIKGKRREIRSVDLPPAQPQHRATTRVDKLILGIDRIRLERAQAKTANTQVV